MRPRGAKESSTMDMEKGKVDGVESVIENEGVYFAALSAAASSAFPGGHFNVFERIWKSALMAFMVVASLLSSGRGANCSVFRKCIGGSEGLSRPLSPQALHAARATVILMVTPFIVWDGFPNPDLFSILKHMEIVWISLLHCSPWPVGFTAFVSGFFCGIRTGTTTNNGTSNSKQRLFGRNVVATIGILVAVTTALLVVISQLQVISPSWAWNPFLWFRFPVYLPEDIAPSMQGICINKDDYYKNPKMPLCLSPHSWKILSSGVLSSSNPQDVATVLKGVDYAKQHKVAVTVMSRDTVDAIPMLINNIEGMAPFFKQLNVVVFENDSKDGSRQAFKDWAKVAKGYTVDLMTCGENNPDCTYGMSHRYDSTEYKDYFKSSAIGKMGDFRQKMVDYITTDPKYRDFSHILVIDIDLKVSFSPLGFMHTLGLGLADDYAIASTGRQTWPGSLGTLTPQYDFSAFRALETPATKRVHQMHAMFCGLMPAGDRWRNQCDAISSMHLFLVLTHEWLGRHHAYPVASAFNGATLYPIEVIRSTHGKYDAGDDSQRCEHIGFNLSLKRHMYVNPKWDFHILPTNPGGPTGIRAIRNVFRIVFVPQLALSIFFQNVIFMSLFVYSFVSLGVFGGTRWARQDKRGDVEILTTLPVNSVSKEL